MIGIHSILSIRSCGQRTFELFPCFVCCQHGCTKNMFKFVLSVLLSTSPEVELLYYLLTLCSFFGRTCIFSSIMTISLHIPTWLLIFLLPSGLNKIFMNLTFCLDQRVQLTSVETTHGVCSGSSDL